MPDVAPGEIIEYTIYFLNTGASPATNVVICDPLSEFLDFIPDTYNDETGNDNGLPTDLGIQLQFGSTTPTTYYLTSINDTGILPPGGAGDRGQFVNAGTNLTGVCKVRTAGAGTPDDLLDDTYGDLTSTENTNGVVVVDVTGGNGPAQIPFATEAGVPDNSHGFIRFRVRVK